MDGRTDGRKRMDGRKDGRNRDGKEVEREMERALVQKTGEDWEEEDEVEAMLVDEQSRLTKTNMKPQVRYVDELQVALTLAMFSATTYAEKTMEPTIRLVVKAPQPTQPYAMWQTFQATVEQCKVNLSNEWNAITMTV